MSFRISTYAWLLLLSWNAQLGYSADATTGSNSWNVIPRSRLVDLPNSIPADSLLAESIGESVSSVSKWLPPSDRKAWKARRGVVQESFRKMLGLDPWPRKTPLNARIVRIHDFETHQVENVVFESRPGFWVTANVYRPKGARNECFPAVVSPIGHFLTPGKTAPEVQARCVKLASLGFVVLVYDAIGQGERMVPGNIHHDAGYALLPLGETIAGWMVWDTMRAVDYLETRSDVDARRIGITGNSGGGLNTLCSAALDERLKAAVVVGFTFEFANWAKYGGAHCTCTHWPGAFGQMNWFEIGGLIAPGALMMIQGGNDVIFPISGARQTARDVGKVYDVLGKSANARLVELPGMPHSYSRPFRESMYGWMLKYLKNEGDGSAVSEGEVATLPERDPCLLCDPEREWIPRTMTVVEWARQTALAKLGHASRALDDSAQNAVRAAVHQWVQAPREKPDSLSARIHGASEVAGGRLEKVSFNSQDGVRLAGLLWTPSRRAEHPRTFVIADGSGKGHFAESGFVSPWLDAGHSVLAVDLRGRGETLPAYGANYDLNFRLLANQILLNRPLAGRRAYDLTRVLDFLATRPDLASNDTVVVGIGDDVLSATLAAIHDQRIRRMVLVDGMHSVLTGMQARSLAYDGKMGDAWNDPQLKGRISTKEGEVDFGTVIPSMLKVGDIPELLAAAQQCRILFCQARDLKASDQEWMQQRFRKVLSQTVGERINYAPDRKWDPELLLKWP